MLLVIKLTSYSCDVVRSRKAEYKEEYKDSVSINWIEWFGYIFFFPSFLTGPTLSFEEYKNITNNCNDSTVLKEIQDEKEQNNALITALVSFFLLIIGMKFLPSAYLYSDAFSKHRFTSKLLIMYITILLVRCKYYFAWSFSKASCIAAGVNSVSATNVNIIEVETASNLRTILSNWNICSANWLKQYVYMRVIEEKYSATIAIFMTNLVSAFWHGFYPGYYLTFFSSGLLTELGKSIRRKITPIFSDSNLGKIFDYSKLIGSAQTPSSLRVVLKREAVSKPQTTLAMKPFTVFKPYSVF
jgi:lysophospholipid acyltransferase